jgi:hypothetical protein
MKRKNKPQPEKPPKAKRKDPRVEYEYEKEITYWCPVRGWVTEKIMVKRCKTKQIDDPRRCAPKVDFDLKELLDEIDDKLTITEDLEEDEKRSDDSD